MLHYLNKFCVPHTPNPFLLVAHMINKSSYIFVHFCKSILLIYSQGEVQILDYQSQQDKLFPLLATSYCFSFVAQSLMQMYKSSESAIQQGDFSKLPEVSHKQ